jgi:hypothetical protein
MCLEQLLPHTDEISPCLPAITSIFTSLFTLNQTSISARCLVDFHYSPVAKTTVGEARCQRYCCTPPSPTRIKDNHSSQTVFCRSPTAGTKTRAWRSYTPLAKLKTPRHIDSCWPDRFCHARHPLSTNCARPEQGLLNQYLQFLASSLRSSPTAGPLLRLRIFFRD